MVNHIELKYSYPGMDYAFPPYGHYRIIKVYDDGSSWVVMMIDSGLKAFTNIEKIAEEIAKAYSVPLINADVV